MVWLAAAAVGTVLVEFFTCFSVHWAAFDTLGLEKR
jgi:hypothetical protein